MDIPEGLSFGSVGLVRCNSSFVLIGQALITCLSNSVWNSIPECIKGI